MKINIRKQKIQHFTCQQTKLQMQKNKIQNESQTPKNRKPLKYECIKLIKLIQNGFFLRRWFVVIIPLAHSYTCIMLKSL